MRIQDQGHSPSGNSLDKVLQIVKKIVEESADGDYLYRGEPKHYCRVSSNLYRRIKCEGLENLDIGRAQEQILLTAQEFVNESHEDDDLLTQLQHFGSVTNLIDFTTDYLIALFFACDQKSNKDGRVILLNRIGNCLLEPRIPENRAIAQKSIFVRPPNGYVKPDKTICVPHEIKEQVLDYLNECHGIRPATIYNDLHGFIRYHQGHESAYLEFYVALTHARKGDYEDAIEGFSNAIKLNPQLTPAYNNRGNVYKDRGENDRAIQDYDKAIKLNPNLAAAYNNRGNVYKDRGEYGCAIQDFDRAIELNTRYAEAYYNRGNAYSEIGKGDSAIQDYDRATKLDPRYVAAYTNRGIAYMQKGNLNRAIQDLNCSIELDSNNAVAYNVRGAAYGSKDEFDCAIQDYDRALELNPKYVAAYTNRGIAYMQKGSFSCATQDLNCAISLNRNCGIAYYNLGLCWLCLKEWEKAQSDLPNAKSLGFDIVSAFRNEFEIVAAFEERYKVKLPANIVAMLTPSGSE